MASYTDRIAALSALVEKRTAEARGWKRVAESRFLDLRAVVGQLCLLEEKALDLPGVAEMGPSAVPRGVRIEDPTTIREGVDAADDAYANLARLIKAMSTALTTADDVAGAALLLGEEDLSCPDEDGHDHGGLSLEEMGAFEDNTATGASPVTPPPDSPSEEHKEKLIEPSKEKPKRPAKASPVSKHVKKA